MLCTGWTNRTESRQTMPDSSTFGNTKRDFIKPGLLMSEPLKPLLSTGLPGVDRLVSRAAEVSALTASVREHLPEPIRPHVVSATMNGSTLVVTVDSAAWSARVRYAGRSLARTLPAASRTAIDKVRVRVRAPA